LSNKSALLVCIKVNLETRLYWGGVKMESKANCRLMARSVCLEELESRIVFDGAIDEALHTVDSAASAVAERDAASKASDHTDGHNEGSETLADGTTHYWSEDWSGENGGRYDHYWYTNGMQYWVYEGSNWDANGNGWQYSGDSLGSWGYIGVELGSPTSGWEYCGDSSGAWVYHGYEWNAGLGWEYAGHSNNEWYYETVYVGDDGGTGHYVGNVTGFEDFNYTWTGGETYHNASGIGTDWTDTCWTGYWTYNYNYEGTNGQPWSVNPVVTDWMVGSLDGTFGNSGWVTTDFYGLGLDHAYSVAIQDDGKIVVAGATDDGDNSDFAVVRYDPDGCLDTSFGSGGRVVTDIGGGDDEAHSIAIQSDGKILVAGNVYNSGNWDFGLVLYNTDGSLDTGFGVEGRVITDIGGSYNFAYSIAMQADGKIVVVGAAANGPDTDFAVVRYNGDGSLDTGFGIDGMVTTDVGGSYDTAYSVAIQTDGKIVVAGNAHNGSNFDFGLVRYNSDGSLDTGFDGDGKITTSIGTSADEAYSVAIQDDGKIVVAGVANNGSNNDFALARYNIDGSLDSGFDGDGIALTDFYNSHDMANSLAIQRDGKIVVVGVAYNPVNQDFALARYNTNGSLDISFGGDGEVTTDIYGGLSDEATSVAIQGNGKICVAGIANNGSNNDFALARYYG
jgi:uncharacterized delta-60 repeat protein